MMGDNTKYTEFRNLKRAMDNGYITKEQFNERAKNAEDMGRGGRKGIDVDKNYNERLQQGLAKGLSSQDAEAKAQKFKQYSELVKSGKDDDAIRLLEGEDIWGYGNVMEAVSKATGKKYLDELTEDQRRRATQKILDYDKINDKAFYSSKGSYNVTLDDELKKQIQESINEPSGGSSSAGSKSFEPRSAEYNKLSKAQKDEYWKARNSGKSYNPSSSPSPEVHLKSNTSGVKQVNNQVIIPRSKTKSPGIDLNGNRIRY